MSLKCQIACKCYVHVRISNTGWRAAAQLHLIWSQSAVKHSVGGKRRVEGQFMRPNNIETMLILNGIVLERVICTFCLLKGKVFELWQNKIMCSISNVVIEHTSFILFYFFKEIEQQS